ncbi:MAG: hypothetical protein ACKOD2_07960, partial [Ilumatobacteraceae bacterium]
YGATQIVIPELDTRDSKLGVRVNPNQDSADGIKTNVSAKPFALTLPGPASNYTVTANKPELVTVSSAGNQINITPTTPGFLGLKIAPKDGSDPRYLGLYIGDQTTGIVPDMSTINGKPPVGTVARTDGVGDQFLEEFNYRPTVAPIDYLYIYDQGGADYTDGNLTGLLTQAVRHGMVPVVVFYNIQAVYKGTAKTYITEGEDPAYQAINEHNINGQTFPDMFTGYMTRYFQKVAKDFTTMNQVGIPVQIVMEPDFLGYMATRLPSFNETVNPKPVPNDADRTLNYANVMKPMTDAGLLTAADPTFDNTITGMVKGINYYVGKNMPNLRIGWKTNIWSVSINDFKNQKMGLLHETDAPNPYPWQSKETAGQGWDTGRDHILTAATNLGNFLAKVGVTYWQGSKDRTPFLTIDKYGVDGAYVYDPSWGDDGTSGTAARTDLADLISAAKFFCSSGCNDSTVSKYFGVNSATLQTVTIDTARPAQDPLFRTVMNTLQNVAKSDPNIARWFFNADQWSNYLLLVKTLSTTVGAPVMLWQIPQGHINGSTLITDRDLSNLSNNFVCPTGTACGFEDSATSFFFGDTFATDIAGRLKHFSEDKAADSRVSVTGNTIKWDEHMTLAGQYGVMSVLFGAGLGPSTRGGPTPAGDVTDLKFWSDKATQYLTRAYTSGLSGRAIRGPVAPPRRRAPHIRRSGRGGAVGGRARRGPRRCVLAGGSGRAVVAKCCGRGLCGGARCGCGSELRAHRRRLRFRRRSRCRCRTRGVGPLGAHRGRRGGRRRGRRREDRLPDVADHRGDEGDRRGDDRDDAVPHRGGDGGQRGPVGEPRVVGQRLHDVV